ncbi:MAG: PLP-dependent aminotransferase family protein [Spirochaetota bacterium]
MTYQDKFSKSALNMRASDIRELLKYTEGRSIISFGGGMPNPEAFPATAITPIIEHVMREHSSDALQYGRTEGHTRLRHAIAQGMGELYDVEESPENIVVTSGSQQALYFLAKLFIDPGDIVLTESPTFLGALLTFRSFLADIRGVPTDRDGMDMDALVDTLSSLSKEGRRPKFIYTVPTVNNPSGSVMSALRRKRLTEIAAEYDTLILEDDPYGLLLFDGTRMPLVKKIDKEERTVYLGTFSKIIAPGFRIGWLAAAPEIARKVALAKQAEDLCTGSFAQHCVFEIMRHHALLPHIVEIVALYRKKAALMTDTLTEHFPKTATWTPIKGGLFVWVTLPAHIDTRVMLASSLERGVAYVAGDAFFPDGSGKNTMRLNFSYPSDGNIIEGIRILGALAAEMQS